MDGVLLITGASTGIGAATARAAAAAGYRVALAARSADRLSALADELGGPKRALAVPCDVRDPDALEAAVERCLGVFGRLDVAVANAGVGLVDRSFLAGTPEDMRETVLVNVLGTALTIRAVLPALTAARGHLVVMGSVLGRVVWPGSLYSATKFAVTAMAESVAEEIAGTGVRVTCVEPGTVDTPFFRTPHSVEGRLVADDVARAVLYAIAQPRHVDVSEILVRPTIQRT